MQRALGIVYPTQCVSCAAPVAQEFALCGACWRQTPFITGLVCRDCGTPLPGEESETDVLCDDCMTIARPWHAGRAALLYKDNARRMVLALKHGDRDELARPAARWMLGAGRGLISPAMLVVPVPIHWTRLLRRRYNQAALLAGELARLTGLGSMPDALIRRKRTPIQDGMGRGARFANMAGAIGANPKKSHALAGRAVLLVDDVMTSGATLAAATEACQVAGATRICILVLARVAKEA
jgi:predicted amidophosphoribosyltransferase